MRQQGVKTKRERKENKRKIKKELKIKRRDIFERYE